MSKKDNKAVRAWRKRMGFTQLETAIIFDLDINTIRNYELGRRCDCSYPVIVPRIILLACAAIEQKLPPIS